MTMQIGLIGKNRIVLASDTKWSTTYAPEKAGRFEELRDEYGETKILLSPEKKLAISCADDMATAFEVAKQIESEWQPESDREGRALRNIVEPFCRELTFQCIIAAMRPEPCLFYVSYDFRYAEENPAIKIINDRICAGDRANPAKFWSLRYYTRSMNIKQLIRLAAQVVVDARYFNSGIIDGLEIVVSDSSGFRHLPKVKCRALEAWSLKESSRFRTSLSS